MDLLMSAPNRRMLITQLLPEPGVNSAKHAVQQWRLWYMSSSYLIHKGLSIKSQLVGVTETHMKRVTTSIRYPTLAVFVSTCQIFEHWCTHCSKTFPRATLTKHEPTCDDQLQCVVLNYHPDFARQQIVHDEKHMLQVTYHMSKWNVTMGRLSLRISYIK